MSTQSPRDEGAAEAAALADGSRTARARTSKLFPAIWRWHFYAGLLSIPIIVILCLSGIVYLFKPQIDSVAWGSMRSVTPQATVRSYAEQERAVLAAFPGGTISQVAPPPADDRAAEWDVLTRDGGTRRVYVNPYTAKVTGSRDPSKSLTTLALDLHGMLLTNRLFGDDGMWGDRLIELTASWALVLVLTGIYLWWPRGRRTKREALIPRLRASSRRMRWRDLHAVTGVLFSFVTLFFLVTGLAWAGIWGAKVWGPFTEKVGSTYPEGTFDGASSGKVADLVKNGKAGWAAGELPLAPSQLPTTQTQAAAPAAGGGGSGDGHVGHTHTDTIIWDPTKGAPIDAILGRAQELGFRPGYTVSYPEDETGSYSVFQFPDADIHPNQQASDQRIAYVDQYTALPIRQHDFSQYGALAQATEFGIALHEGREWGLASQLLTLVGTLALLLSCATAVVMWRKRKPKGIGAPRRAPDRRLGAGVVASTLVLGAVFPVLGASILVLLLLDLVIVRRIPPLARALGAR